MKKIKNTAVQVDSYAQWLTVLDYYKYDIDARWFRSFDHLDCSSRDCGTEYYFKGKKFKIISFKQWKEFVAKKKRVKKQPSKDYITVSAETNRDYSHNTNYIIGGDREQDKVFVFGVRFWSQPKLSRCGKTKEQFMELVSKDFSNVYYFIPPTGAPGPFKTTSKSRKELIKNIEELGLENYCIKEEPKQYFPKLEELGSGCVVKLSNDEIWHTYKEGECLIRRDGGTIENWDYCEFNDDLIYEANSSDELGTKINKISSPDEEIFWERDNE